MTRPRYEHTAASCAARVTNGATLNGSTKGSMVVLPRKLILGAAALVVFICGCSGQGLVRVKGQLLYNEKPLEVSEKAGISIMFIKLEAGDKPAMYPAAPLDRDDATFTVPGPTGRGIPPGKYRIAITQRMADDLPPEVEKMNEMFSRGNSAIEREVTNSDPIILDLSKPGG